MLAYAFTYIYTDISIMRTISYIKSRLVLVLLFYFLVSAVVVICVCF